MPTVETNGARIYYEVHGEGPVVVLAHGRGGARPAGGSKSRISRRSTRSSSSIIEFSVDPSVRRKRSIAAFSIATS